MSLFTVTASIKKAVSLVNSLDSGKFPLLLSRILQKLHLKDERAFSEEEEEKLQSAFGLEGEELDLVITTCEFILQQAAYHTAKPAVLQQQLQQIGLEDEKVEAVVQMWTNMARGVVDKLRKRTIAPKQLEDVNWRLNLQMAQANKAKMKLPTAMFELGIKDENSDTKEKTRLEFTHDELYAFYNQLETIQSQVDSLS
ncbi:COMM domain-containing protein 10 [Lingula anatina]|uniref:COMM domain-containing protein 10 n=1 Tax=Lingula anatina TaxID=7574 RepID=A0A1S3JWK8_LINAN|nr:COMM domain-containing protein 10 [Lingula anatina]|eukprot:XP_013414424.1 COMM domain-containing protein 10 [Lingula anatina]